MAKTHHNNYNIRMSHLSLGISGGTRTMTGCDTGDNVLSAIFFRHGTTTGTIKSSGPATVVVASTNTVTLTTLGLGSTNGSCVVLWVDQDQAG